MSNLPIYTALLTAALIILHLVLLFRVIAQRRESKVSLGDGGDEALLRAIRVQGNLLENAPIFLIGLALVELLSGDPMIVVVLGGLFLLSRILHAVGLSMTAGATKGRQIGTIGSVLTTLGVGGYLAWLAWLAL